MNNTMCVEKLFENLVESENSILRQYRKIETECFDDPSNANQKIIQNLFKRIAHYDEENSQEELTDLLIDWLYDLMEIGRNADDPETLCKNSWIVIQRIIKEIFGVEKGKHVIDQMKKMILDGSREDPDFSKFYVCLRKKPEQTKEQPKEQPKEHLKEEIQVPVEKPIEEKHTSKIKQKWNVWKISTCILALCLLLVSGFAIYQTVRRYQFEASYQTVLEMKDEETETFSNSVDLSNERE